MTIQQHIQDTIPGVAGATIAGSFTLTGFLVSATPFLQALSLLIGCIAGLVTIVYYVVQIKKRK